MVKKFDDKYRLAAGADPVAWLTERAAQLEQADEQQATQAEIPDLVKQCPNLHAVLMARFSASKVERGAAINIWEQDGKLTACLTLRWAGRKAFYTAETWQALWEGLEALIANPDTVWRSEDGKRPPAASRSRPGGKPGRAR